MQDTAGTRFAIHQKAPQPKVTSWRESDKNAEHRGGFGVGESTAPEHRSRHLIETQFAARQRGGPAAADKEKQWLSMGGAPSQSASCLLYGGLPAREFTFTAGPDVGRTMRRVRPEKSSPRQGSFCDEVILRQAASPPEVAAIRERIDNTSKASRRQRAAESGSIPSMRQRYRHLPRGGENRPMGTWCANAANEVATDLPRAIRGKIRPDSGRRHGNDPLGKSSAKPAAVRTLLPHAGRGLDSNLLAPAAPPREEGRFVAKRLAPIR